MTATPTGGLHPLIAAGAASGHLREWTHPRTGERRWYAKVWFDDDGTAHVQDGRGQAGADRQAAAALALAAANALAAAAQG